MISWRRKTRGAPYERASCTWILNHPTPQVAPILDALCHAEPGHHTVHYLQKGAKGRGWGSVRLDHRHRFITDGRSLRMAWEGMRLALGQDTTLVTFGYRHPMQIGALAAARMMRRQVITRSDSKHSMDRAKPRMKRLAKKLILRCLFSTKRTLVWTVGKENADYWRSYGFGHLEHIPFESPIPSPITTVEHALPTILFVGRLAPEKGLLELREACRLLDQRQLRFRLRIVGSGPSATLFEHEHYADLVGDVPHRDLGAELAAASVLAIPSRFEAYGLVVREALQFGLPVVASYAVAAAQELCDHGWNIVDLDPVQLSDALQQALSLPTRWPPMPPRDVTPAYLASLRALRSQR